MTALLLIGQFKYVAVEKEKIAQLVIGQLLTVAMETNKIASFSFQALLKGFYLLLFEISKETKNQEYFCVNNIITDLF